jgi:hypothetical protein
MAETQATLDKRDEKKPLEKEAATAIYLNFTKEVIEVQMMDVDGKMADTEAKLCDGEARRMDAEAKTRAKDTRIMLADLNNMDDDTNA